MRVRRSLGLALALGGGFGLYQAVKIKALQAQEEDTTQVSSDPGLGQI